MKILFLLALLPVSTLALDFDRELQGMKNGPRATCEESELYEPPVTKGEAKITYPCGTIEPSGKVNRRVITFYEKANNPAADDLIIRGRSADKTETEGDADKDFTLKYRAGKEQKLGLKDKDSFERLKARQKIDKFSLKCEADVTYSGSPQGDVTFKRADSCSITTPNAFFKENDGTADFMGLVGKSVPTKAEDLVKYEIKSEAWSLRNAEGGKLGIGLEKWTMEREGESLCILEASAKFEAVPPQNIEEAIKESLKKIRNNITQEPSPKQGNKTAQAISFLKGTRPEEADKRP